MPLYETNMHRFLVNEVWREAECVSSFTVASFMRHMYIRNIHTYIYIYNLLCI